MIADKITRCILKTVYSGNNYYCPICNRSYRKFLQGGIVQRPNTRCPGCDSLERHRLLWAALERSDSDIKMEGTLLHVAPEKCLSDVLQRRFECISIDLQEGKAMYSMDICSLQFTDNYFDAIVCNHVLEHVQDDYKALYELFRVLKKDGWASIQVPIFKEITAEDLSITDPLERKKLYGQDDHVRRYGRDFKAKLEQAGFFVKVIPKSEITSSQPFNRMSVAVEKDIWICLKK